METIPLKMSRRQLEAIFYGLKALTDSMAAYLAEKPEPEKESTKERDVNTIITSLATNTSLKNTNTYQVPNTSKDTLIRNNTSASASNNNINNNNINNAVDDDDVTTTSKISNTYQSSGIPTLEDVEVYVRKCGYKMSAQKFFNYYRGLGWKTKTGTSIVGIWRGYVDTWAKNEYAPAEQPQQTASAPTGKNAGMGTVEDRHATHPFVPSF